MNRLTLKGAAIFLLLSSVHLASFSQRVPFPTNSGVMEGDSAALSMLIGGGPNGSVPGAVSTTQITNENSTNTIDLAGKTVNYSMCVDMPWGSWAGVCPANYVLVGAWRRGSDTGEWNSFRCCKIQ